MPDRTAPQATIRRIIDVRPIILSPTGNLRRTPPRAPEDQQSDYLEKFDHHLLMADIVNTPEGLLGFGPPMLNLQQHLPDLPVSLDGSPIRTALGVEPRTRLTRFTFPGSEGRQTSRVEVSIGEDSYSVDASPAQGDLFRGLNVLATQQKDNDLDNIRDWVDVHARVNAINAVLIYDNSSAAYTAEELLHTIAPIAGIEVAVVVRWPHKWGPTGGPHSKWDSDYGQYQSWEHMRWRFLQEARTVMLSDVDEIPLIDDGRTCAEAALSSPDGVAYYRMRDLVPFPVAVGVEGRPRRHVDFNYSYPTVLKNWKFTYVPSRLHPDQQVRVHDISGSVPPAQPIGYCRHFLGIHRNWRAGTNAYTYKLLAEVPDGAAVDRRLAEALGQSLG